MNVLEMIHQKEEELSSKQKIIADFILSDYKKAAFMNSVELSRTLKVSNPTIIRFAAELGYKSFPEFQSELQALVYNHLNTVERTEKLPLDDSDDYISSIFRNEIKNLETVYRSIDASKIDQASDLMINSSPVYIIGELAAGTVAFYTNYTLNKILPDVYQIHSIDFHTFAKHETKGKQACALIFIFSRYSTKTMELMRKMKDMGTSMIVVTDSKDFPLLHLADISIIIPLNYFVFLDPMAASMCVANCLITGIFEKNHDASMERLNLFEEYAKNQNIFYKP